MNNNVIGLDTSKNIFHLYAIDSNNKEIKRKIKRSELLEYFANFQISIIGIEACACSHHWARELTKLGHEVILLNTKFVKGFLVGNKNDFNDAQAIHEAVLRPNKRIVQAKTIKQQDIQMIHGVRQELIGKRTALVNQMRGFLSERGVYINTGINNLRKNMPFILEDAENGLSAVSREMFQEMYERLKVIDDQIKAQDRRIARLCQENELSNRFIEVPGIGPIISTIICADLGENAKGYESGRDYTRRGH